MSSLRPPYPPAFRRRARRTSRGIRPCRVAAVASALVWAVSAPSPAASQQKRRALFEEDLRKQKQVRQQKKQDILGAGAAPAGEDVDVKAPTVEYERDTGKMRASGGVVVSRPGLRVQAERARVDLGTKEAEIVGDILVSSDQGSLTADSAYMNLDSETGVFNGSTFSIDNGEYRVNAGRATKYSEYRYKLVDSTFTTCDCEDGKTPWSLRTREADITEEGYAHTYGATLRFYDVPVFYTPYLGFPAKRKRASGLLVPDIGYSNQNGFRYRQPLYWVTGETSDVLFDPFVETKTRYGTGVQVRREFGIYNSLSTKWIYSDEGTRGDDPRGVFFGSPGTPLDIKEKRIGGYLKHAWRRDPESAGVPLTYLADVHYVNDDFMLREIPNDDIGLTTAPFLTSTALLRAGLGDVGTAELSGEFNQIIDTNLEASDDTALHRLPELSVSGQKSYRAFGYNPYGAKVVIKGGATATEFAREVGTEGRRLNVNPVVAVPFHYKNVFNSEVQASLYETRYSVTDDTPGSPADGSSGRRTGVFQYTMSTALERPYSVRPGGTLETVAGLGLPDRDERLTRLKHVVEPVVRYTYVPDVSQDSLPLFDSVDRIRQRSLVTYGVVSTLYGRFVPSDATSSPVPELTPGVQDLPELGYIDSVPSVFGDDSLGIVRRSGRTGGIRELVTLSVRQNYDYIEDKKDVDPARRPFSDFTSNLDVALNRSFSFGLEGNVSPYKADLSSWGANTTVKDDRGDLVRLRYTFIDPVVVQNGLLAPSEDVSQVDGAGELVLSERFKLGYFARYDMTQSEFIEQAVALRLFSSCNCWYVDVGVSDRLNPDRQQFNLRFTFAGLGDITQDILYKNRPLDTPQ